ncbi:DEAD/DEAH box helicase [Paraburkholderia hospita]|uniref:DEAD/DEAH box helicase n=1 Tax=Paraburkholderia hospita TaxID=169430 RepID=UPI003F4F6A1A
MVTVSQLSAMPLFLRNQNFWNRLLDPLTQSGKNGRFKELRLASATHRWFFDDKGVDAAYLSPTQLGLVDVAQSILERGPWTLPTWRMEEQLAENAVEEFGWQLTAPNRDSGDLSYRVESSSPDAHFQNALVTGRWPCEVTSLAAADEIWNNYEGDERGSEMERRFFYDVLVPVLGFPLLDFLRLQPELLTLGLDPLLFTGQRADFSLNTGRGLKLLIEVDGGQHRDESQLLLDEKRNKALEDEGWTIWRIPTSRLRFTEQLQRELGRILKDRQGATDWGVTSRIETPRSRELLTCVWGATAASRIQFLLLEAIRRGVLEWNKPWRVSVIEADTAIGRAALEDFQDWFGRLREIFGESPAPAILDTEDSSLTDTQLVIDISVIQPHLSAPRSGTPVAWSRPANYVGPVPKRKFAHRMMAPEEPPRYLVESFVQDFLRKSGLREGQFEIVTRILMGKDVIGLLPTGGGKSLTYQLCGLLLGGLTIYVSPLKSLLQDQRERFFALGVERAQEISSALTPTAKHEAGQLLSVGGIRFLLIAPERLLIRGFRQQLDQFRARFGEVTQVVIDECHCVSEWGHDFRPAYLSLSRIVKERTKRLGVSAPLVALTGTASSIVLSDVKRELGILEDGASVRARRLDRPEIAMSCMKLRNNEKAQVLQENTEEFVLNSSSRTDGLLVFSRFVGGLEGVVGVSSSMMSVIPNEMLRFYSGSEPNWNQYAAFVRKRKAKTISKQEALQAMPLWALSPDGKPLAWEQVKAKVQSDFISGLPGSYQVLVATNAFGMGIDKPSIRCVIHYMTPQSPEAYYQEVGRAGRDKKASRAVLLFSDEDPGITDKIFDPGASIAEARQIYKEFVEKQRYGGGDFIKTFFFHQSTFTGPEAEANVVTRLLEAVRNRIDSGEGLLFEYFAENPKIKDEKSNDWREEKSLEYAIVRLILLGVVKDYTKDYKSQQFDLTLEPAWYEQHRDPKRLADYYARRFREYSHRYQTYLKVKGEEEIRAAETVKDIESATADALVGFVYEQIERKRRQASRQMLELARIGAEDHELFRERLNHYLQVSEKFTRELELLAQDDSLQTWHAQLASVGSRDEVAELHGACQRVLESYPTHPGLLSISAATRLTPTDDDLKRSEEEFNAALRYAAEVGGIDDAKELGNSVASYAADVDETLADMIQTALGVWMITNGMKDEAIHRFSTKRRVRERWVTSLLRDVQEGIPEMREL